MVDQNTFLETLNSVKDIISTAEVPMKEEEILSYFKDMELDGSQKAMVIDYLMTPENYKEQQEDSKEDRAADIHNTEEPVPGGVKSFSGELNVYQMYLEELDTLQTYSAEEVDRFYRLLLQGDDSVIEKISHAWLLRITNLAQQYMEPKLLLEDLVQEGNIALFMELQRLCGSMEKVDVEMALNEAIEQGIMNYAGEIRDTKEMEESIASKMNLIQAARNILTEEKGRVPEIKELVQYTKISEKELTKLLDMIEEADRKGKN